MDYVWILAETPFAGFKPETITPEAPPGDLNDLWTILKWMMWVGAFISVVAVIFAGVNMVIAAGRGEGGEGLARLAWVLGGAVLIGLSSGIIGVLL